MQAKITQAGASLDHARAVVVLVHGRGADAASMLEFAESLAGDLPGSQDLAFLAPQAPNYTWYPYSFLAPINQNEPYLSASLQILAELLAGLQRQGIREGQIMLVGFSQGACLSLEFAARNPRAYGGIAGFSGGLIGPPGTPRNYQGSLAGVPVFLGCSDTDPHIPKERVWETAQVLEQMGAEVTTRIYPGMGHIVNEDEIEIGRRMLAVLLEKNVHHDR